MMSPDDCPRNARCGQPVPARESTPPAIRARARVRTQSGGAASILRVTVVAALLPCALASWAAPRSEPVTAGQRAIADQVARAGVPLSALAPDAPDRHVVQRGDTLWALASRYLRSPWRWPELWGMNRNQIRNPHWIYPGQVLVLVKTNGRARLTLEGGAGAGQAGIASTGSSGHGSVFEIVKLSPRVRDLGPTSAKPISSIPNNLIEPFLSQRRVVSASELDKFPEVIATQDDRLYLGENDFFYARGIRKDAAQTYHVFGAAEPMYEPDDVAHKKPIAYEARYLGTAQVIQAGPISKLRILDSVREIGAGDRLVPIEHQDLIAYVPRRPDKPVHGRIVAVYGGVTSVGADSVVAIDRGARDGLEIGDVLTVLQPGATMVDQTSSDQEHVRLPDVHAGRMFVFRVFDGISYALLMTATNPVRVGDYFQQPGDTESTADMAAAR